MRFIKNYTPFSLTNNFLENIEWDIIELNKSIDISKLQNWYYCLEEKFSYLKFNFKTNLNLLNPKAQGIFNTDLNGSTFNLDRNEIEGLSSYTLSWITEKDIALPPPWAVNFDFFPELKSYYIEESNVIDIDYENYYCKCNFLNQYMFGYFQDLTQILGKYIYNPRVSIHDPYYTLKPHVDKPYLGRLHIPIVNEDSLFCWGDNLEREYKLSHGKMYIINSRITHGTKNGKGFRANLISDIIPNQLLNLINL